MESLRHPVGPLPPAVYWRRRVVVFGVPVVLIGLLAYSCSASGGSGKKPVANASPYVGASSSPSGPAGGRSSSAPVVTASPGPSGPVVPGDGTGSVPGGASSGGSSGSASGGPSASGGSGSGARVGSGGSSSGVGGTQPRSNVDCALKLHVSTDQQSYPAGVRPKLTVTVDDVGTGSCTFDTNGQAAGALVVLITAADGSRVWSSADCPAGQQADDYTLDAGKGTSATLVWDRHRSATGCPANQPLVAAGSYQVTVSADGVSSEPASFQLA